MSALYKIESEKNVMNEMIHLQMCNVQKGTLHILNNM